ncbi:MAG: hypothetical protein AAGJ46_01945 [Planctomycetota bacterium]
MLPTAQRLAGTLIATGLVIVAASCAGVAYGLPLVGTALVAVGAMGLFAGRRSASPLLLALQAVIYLGVWLLMAGAIAAKGEAAELRLSIDLLLSTAVMALQAPLLVQASRSLRGHA